MDKLEKYILDNIESLDSSLPPHGMWDKINVQIESKVDEPNRQSKLVWMITKIAVAFAVVLASGIVMGYYINDNHSNLVSYDPVFQDYIDVEKKYAKDINHKMIALSVHDVDPQVNRDLMQLDEVYEELKE